MVKQLISNHRLLAQLGQVIFMMLFVKYIVKFLVYDDWGRCNRVPRVHFGFKFSQPKIYPDYDLVMNYAAGTCTHAVIFCPRKSLAKSYPRYWVWFGCYIGRTNEYNCCSKNHFTKVQRRNLWDSWHNLTAFLCIRGLRDGHISVLTSIWYSSHPLWERAQKCSESVTPTTRGDRIELIRKSVLAIVSFYH